MNCKMICNDAVEKSPTTPPVLTHKTTSADVIDKEIAVANSVRDSLS